MVNGIGIIYTYELNKGFGLKFCVGSQVRHEPLEESQRTHQIKHCEYNKEVKDIS